MDLRRHLPRALTSLLTLAAACGGAAAPPTNSGAAPGTPAGATDDSAKVAEHATWPAPGDAAALEAYVRTAALKRLAEDQPEVASPRLEEWTKNPGDAPALSGRAVERLLTLAAVAASEGKLDLAEGFVRLVRARAANRNSAFAGTTLLTVAALGRAADEAARRAAVEAVLSELPPERLGQSTVTFQLYQNADQLTARATKTREQTLSLDTGATALYFERVLPHAVAHRGLVLEAIAAVEQKNKQAPKPKKYAFGTASPAAFGKPAPVRIAVWDVGTNPDLFRKQLFVNTAEKANGADDDGNGIVDDLHGIASDVDPAQTALLYTPAPDVLKANKPFLKGVMDLRAGLSTTADAKKVLALFAEAKTPEAVETLETNLDAVGEWAHGTHVAGIMLQGLPKAELAIFRSAWAGESRVYHHRGPTDAELDAERANIRAISDFIRRHKIRVVNASLGFAVDYVEGELAHEKDKYPNETAIRERAKAIQSRRRAQWREVFQACPDTLFVLAAGNSNRDVLEYGDTPADTSLENVLVVGAVDEFGKWAMFTNSNREQVKVFDFGVAVPSLIPSGERVPLSGTSMAAPNAANAAAKVLTAFPALTPEQVIALLVETGDDIAPPFSGKIVNEKKALEAAKARTAKAAP